MLLCKESCVQNSRCVWLVVSCLTKAGKEGLSSHFIENERVLIKGSFCDYKRVVLWFSENWVLNCGYFVMFCEKSGTSFSQDVETLHPKFSLFFLSSPFRHFLYLLWQKKLLSIKDQCRGIKGWPVAVTWYINLHIKVAEHSFRARFCWCNSARAQGLQKTNMLSTERSFYLLNTRSICAIFLYNWTRCIGGFSLLSQIYTHCMLEKVKMERIQQFSAFSLLPKEPS